MRLRLLHRCVAILSLLALLGFAAQGFAGAEAGAMAMSHASGDCDDCSDGKGMPAVDCQSLCSGVAAILPALAAMRTALLLQLSTPLALAQGGGRGAAPDPYPPKTAIAS